jgi:hypothetical protein
MPSAGSMRTKWWVGLVVFAGVLIVSAHPLSGQTATATLNGVVVDSSGAAIPDARVTTVNRSTGISRTMTTTDGAFTVSSVPPGRYDVTAERDGFQKAELLDVVLEVGDRVSLRITLQLGSVADAVTVTAETPRIRTTPGVATVIDRAFVENLPMNGRTFQSLIQLTPGAVPTTATTTQQGQFSVNGSRESTNALNVDGVAANLGVSGSGANFNGASGQFGGFNAVGATSSLVSLEAMQEFTVQTSGFAPEYGRTPGGQVSIVTRSGTNAYSGSLFDYFRHDALNANDFFANARGIPKPQLRNHQFGGVFGGPVLLGNAYDGRNKSFFFFSYEGLRQRIPTVAIVDVPSLASRTAATGAIAEILNAYPKPTGPDLPSGVAQFAGGYSTPARADTTSLRLDHRASDRLTVFGRYNYAPSEMATRGASSNSLSVLVLKTLKFHTLTLGATSVISTRSLNELRVNLSQNRGHEVRIPDDYGGAAPPNTSVLFPSFISPDDSVVSIVTTGLPNLFLGSQGSNAQRQLNIVNTFSWSAGSHQWKFGLDYRRLTPIFDFVAYQQTINFPNVAALLAGNASGAIVQALEGPFYPRFTNLSLYAQDTWSASPRLTLTYGLRYELNPAPSEKNGHDPRTVTGVESPATIALAPEGTPPFKTTYNNLAPRVGAAYVVSNQTGRETVVRGGVGVFYDVFSTQTGAAYRAFSYPYAATRTLTPARYPLTAENASTPTLTTDPPYNFVYGSDPNLELPYTIQFNVGVERSLGASQTASATYIRTAGRRLYRTEFYQSEIPNFSQLRIVRNLDWSDYNALQLQYRRRLSSGLQVLAQYTLSKSTDTSSSEAQMYLPVAVSSSEQNLGPSDFDRRHAYSLAATYQIPSPGSGWVHAALRDFSIDVIHRALSAAPVDVTSPGGSAINLLSLRPDVVSGAPLVVDDASVPGGQRLNRAAFLPRTDTHGSLGRNALRGFPFSQLDLAVRRHFTVGKTRLELRAEAFNALNQANFANPVANLTNTTFGQATQMFNSIGGLNSLYQIGGPRAFQLAVRVQF